MQRLDFNRGWSFYKEGSGAAPVRVDLPHDAMLYEQRDPSCKNGSNTAWYPGGVYEYQKEFFIPEEYRDKFVAIEFEGVYRHAKVWVNDRLFARQAYGYTGFCAVPDNLHYGGTNTVRVRAENAQEPDARWYTGSGIYREVHLLVANKAHFAPEEIFIKTVSTTPAVVELEAGPCDGEVRVEILDRGGAVVAHGTGAQQRLTIPDAQLWDEESPYLYRARFTLMQYGEVVDEQLVPFGVRAIEWSPARGLCINGRETKLRGACLHHDNGVLGACAFREAERRKIRILKAVGFNAIRSAHNPCSKALLDACDEYGMYVMDEAFDQWFTPKNKFDYARDFERWHESDLAAMVKKDRNHPCVILYSIGNEISETQQPRGIEMTKKLVHNVKALDDSRPVTCGINLFLNGLISKGVGIYREDGEGAAAKAASGGMDKNKKLAGSAFFNYMMEHMGAIKNFVSKAKFADKATRDAFACLDVCGYNYGSARYAMDGKKYPKRVIVGSETFVPDLYKNWKKVQKHPYLIGDFIWTGWDYLGEAGLGCWNYGGTGFAHVFPTLLADSGVIDITGFITAECRYAQTAYGIESGPHIGVRPLPHAGEKVARSPWRSTDAVESWSWNGCEGKTAQVEVYTNAARVRLCLNGKPVGNVRPRYGVARCAVPYAAGELTAETFDKKGRPTGRAGLKTAKERIRLTVLPEKEFLRADGQDLLYLDIRITDEDGIVKVLEDRSVRVCVEGAGVLQGLGSAAPHTQEIFTDDVHKTYYGRSQAVVRSNGESGEVRVTVSCEGTQDVLLRFTADSGQETDAAKGGTTP